MKKKQKKASFPDETCLNATSQAENVTVLIVYTTTAISSLPIL